MKLRRRGLNSVPSLQLAGVAVKKATEELVKAAENSMITVQDQPFGADVSCSLPCWFHSKHTLWSDKKRSDEKITNYHLTRYGVVFLYDVQVNVPTRARDRFKQQLEKQEEIARKRRELESLEAQLSRIRKEGRNQTENTDLMADVTFFVPCFFFPFFCVVSESLLAVKFQVKFLFFLQST